MVQIYTMPKEVLEDEENINTVEIMKSIGVEFKEKKDNFHVYFLKEADVEILMKEYKEVEKLNLKKLLSLVS